MRTKGIILFLPAIVLISLLGFGAGTALAHSGPGTFSTDGTGVISDLRAVQISPGPLDGSASLASTLAATGAKRRAFVGTVTGSAVYGITGSEVDLILQGTAVKQTIYLPGGYKFKTPGGTRAGYFEPGARMVILAEQNGYHWVAIGGVVKPVKPHVPKIRVVVDVEGDMVTVVSPEGDAETFTLPDDLGDVTPGEVLTVFEEESGEVTGLVSANQIQERLDEFLEEATTEEEEEASAEDTELRSRRVQAVIDALDRFGANHLRILYQVEDRVPEHGRLHIESMMAKVEADRRNSRSAIERAKAKLQERDLYGNASVHEDHRPEARGGPPEHADEEDRIRGKSSGEEHGPESTSSKRPATTGGPRVDSQGDADGSDALEVGQRRGSSGNGKNR